MFSEWRCQSWMNCYWRWCWWQLLTMMSAWTIRYCSCANGSFLSLGTKHCIRVCSLLCLALPCLTRQTCLALYTKAVITEVLKMGIVRGTGTTDAEAAETFLLFIIVVLYLGGFTEQSLCSVTSLDFYTAYGLRRVNWAYFENALFWLQIR